MNRREMLKSSCAALAAAGVPKLLFASEAPARWVLVQQGHSCIAVWACIKFLRRGTVDQSVSEVYAKSWELLADCSQLFAQRKPWMSLVSSSVLDVHWDSPECGSPIFLEATIIRKFDSATLAEERGIHQRINSRILRMRKLIRERVLV